MESDGGRGRVRRTPAQWRQLIAEQATAEVGVGQFCRERGLASSSFRNWKRKLGECGASDGSAADFVELTVPDTASHGAQWDVELELGDGTVLRVRRG